MIHQESTSIRRIQNSPVLGAIRRPLTAAVVLFASTQAWALQSGVGNSATRAGSASSSGGSAPLVAPEINPAFIVGAAVLLIGGLLILTSRRRAAKA